MVLKKLNNEKTVGGKNVTHFNAKELGVDKVGTDYVVGDLGVMGMVEKAVMEEVEVVDDLGVVVLDENENPVTKLVQVLDEEGVAQTELVEDFLPLFSSVYYTETKIDFSPLTDDEINILKGESGQGDG